jgi:hypothetical protein
MRESGGRALVAMYVLAPEKLVLSWLTRTLSTSPNCCVKHVIARLVSFWSIVSLLVGEVIGLGILAFLLRDPVIRALNMFVPILKFEYVALAGVSPQRAIRQLRNSTRYASSAQKIKYQRPSRCTRAPPP